MNVYREKWDYNLTSSSSPYGLNNGNPYFSGGYCYFPVDSFITKDYNGFPYDFKGNSYVGSYAISFPIDMVEQNDGTEGSMFTILIYDDSVLTPCLRHSWGAMELGWASYGSTFNTYGNGNVTWTLSGAPYYESTWGPYIQEPGQYQIIFIKDQYNSRAAMCLVSPTGLEFKTPWFTVSDPYNRIQIGSNIGSDTLIWEIGQILVNDSLSPDDISNIYSSCSLATGPAVIVQPPAGTFQQPITITLAQPSDAGPGWDIKYTTDGSSPIDVGISYSGSFIIGDPLLLNTTTVVKAVCINTLGQPPGPISSNSYYFSLKPPIFKNINGYSAAAIYGTEDTPIDWVDRPVSGITEIVYTIDGSDPIGSGTAIIWSAGDKIRFNSYPIDPGVGTPSTYQINSPLKAVTRYIQDGSVSEQTSTGVSFYFNDVFMPLGNGKLNDDLSYIYRYSNGGTNTEYLYSTTIDSTQSSYTGYTPINIPFDSNTHTVQIRISTLDGSLYTDCVGQSSVSFYQKPPYIQNRSIVSSIPVHVEPYNQNGTNSIMYYTLNGSIPTQSSQILSSGVSVPVGGMLKVIAVRDGITSTISKLEVLSEYEVTEVATTLESSSYHYHIAAQRTSLTNKLSPSSIQANIGSITTPSGVAVNVYGNNYQISQWDSGDYTGYVNSFSGIRWRPYQTKTRSRLAYSSAAFNIDWEYNKDLFNGKDTADLFIYNIYSRLHRVSFLYTIDIDTSVATITKTYTNISTGATDIDTMQGGIISVSGDNTIIITIEPGTISFNDLQSAAEESRPELLGDIKWNIEIIANPGEIILSAPNYDGRCSITTIADYGHLLMAPGSMMCSKGSSLVSDTINIDFRDKDSVNKIKHSILTEEQNIYPPAIIGYDDIAKVTKIDGQFVLAMPGIIDTSSDFDSEVDISTDFLSLMTYPDNNIGQETLPAVTMFLADPNSQLNSSLSIDVGISLRMYVPTDRAGAYPIYLELYSYGHSPSRLTLSSNNKQIKFKISSRQSTIHLSAVVDGMETLLASINSIEGRYKEVRLMRTGATRQPRKQITDIIKYASTSTFNRVLCTSPILVGADFMFRGVATGFDTTSIDMQGRNISAIWFNPDSRVISSEEMAFEPSDGRLLVGVLENDDGNLLWTNTMYSTLVKVRTEINGSLVGGTTIGVGSNLKIKNGLVTWTENGYDKSTAIGNLSWTRPNSYLDLANNRQIVKVLEKQRVKITGAAVS